jgi:hypothetical protein
MPDIRKLLGPLGTATTYNQSVVVVDRVDNIRRVAQLVADAEAAEARRGGRVGPVWPAGVAQHGVLIGAGRPHRPNASSASLCVLRVLCV